MDISTINQGWKLGLETGDKKKEEAAGGSFAGILAGIGNDKPVAMTAAEKFAKQKAINDGYLSDFAAEMKKTPMERKQEAWLKAHGLTKESLAEKSPEEQKAIMDAMTKDIEEQIKREAEEKAKTGEPLVA